MRLHETEPDQGAGGSMSSRTAFDGRQTDERPAFDDARVNKVKALFLLAAGLSFLASVSLWFLADREQGLFVGLWVPSILALGALLLSGNRGAR